MLLIGYGNPGRGDDGLGPAFAERIARAKLPGVEVSVDYQLTVDHALEVAAADRVVIADAEIGLCTAYRLRPLAPAENGVLMSHSLSPGDVLALARLLYGRAPDAHILGIAGTEFAEIKEGLSAVAAANLERAEAFFLDWVRRGRYQTPMACRIQRLGSSAAGSEAVSVDVRRTSDAKKRQ